MDSIFYNKTAVATQTEPRLPAPAPADTADEMFEDSEEGECVSPPLAGSTLVAPAGDVPAAAISPGPKPQQRRPVVPRAAKPVTKRKPVVKKAGAAPRCQPGQQFACKVRRALEAALGMVKRKGAGSGITVSTMLAASMGPHLKVFLAKFDRKYGCYCEGVLRRAIAAP